MANESSEIVSVELPAPSGWKKMVSFCLSFSYVCIFCFCKWEGEREDVDGVLAEIVGELNWVIFFSF